LFIGVLLGLADAVITKSYAPILGLGAAGGALIGFLSSSASGASSRARSRHSPAL